MLKDVVKESLIKIISDNLHESQLKSDYWQFYLINIIRKTIYVSPGNGHPT